MIMYAWPSTSAPRSDIGVKRAHCYIGRTGGQSILYRSLKAFKNHFKKFLQGEDYAICMTKGLSALHDVLSCLVERNSSRQQNLGSKKIFCFSFPLWVLLLPDHEISLLVFCLEMVQTFLSEISNEISYLIS